MRGVDCAVVRDAFRAGQLPHDAALLEHVRQCPRCTELFADDARLGRALGSEQATELPARELWAGVQARLRDETGPRAWVRSRSTPFRIALAVSVGALVVFAAHGGKHVGLAHRGGYEPLVWIAAFALLGVAHVVFALRPLGRAGASPLARMTLLFGAAALPVLLSLTASRDIAREMPFMQEATACFLLGLGLAAPFAGSLWLLDRGERLGAWGVVLVACAGGLVANLALSFRCPVHERAHLLVGHAPIALGIALGIVLVRRLRASSAAR